MFNVIFYIEKNIINNLGVQKSLFDGQEQIRKL